MDKILWVDIEGSGLNPDIDIILEIGLRITDAEGNNLDEITSLVWTPNWRAYLVKNEIVFDMHQKSGLIDDLADLERRGAGAMAEASIGNVSKRLCDWIQERLGDQSKKMPMAGNSVHYDRMFLLEHAADLHNMWFYRNFDVSSTREQLRIANPVLFSRLPVPPKSHRPQADITDSITLWQWLLDNFLYIP